MKTIHFNAAAYMASAVAWDQLPPDIGAEVAFLGRSNAGKSSAINAITRQKGLAKTSVTPGRTQMINFFQLDGQKRLVDLPGYGFAKVPPTVKARWQQFTRTYLEQRESLAGLIVLMDARHPLKDMDVEIIEWAIESQVPLHLLLTKADKITPNAQRSTLAQVTAQLADFSDHFTIQLFSALKGTGIDAVKNTITAWLTKG